MNTARYIFHVERNNIELEIKLLVFLAFRIVISILLFFLYTVKLFTRLIYDLQVTILFTYCSFLRLSSGLGYWYRAVDTAKPLIECLHDRANIEQLA